MCKNIVILIRLGDVLQKSYLKDKIKKLENNNVKDNNANIT